MPSQRISALLRGNDRRSIGRSNEVVELVFREPRRFPELLKCLWNDNPIVRMRAADAAEKISIAKPGLLSPYKAELLGLLCEAHQIELRWHLAQMIPRLPLTAAERIRAPAALQGYLEDRSSIVRTFALQGLADLAGNDGKLRGTVREFLEQSARTGTAAMKARARILLRKLQD
jgi:hypothetical protein